MKWRPDVPDLNFPKPKELEKIEQLTPAQLNSMDGWQIEKIIQDAAFSIAQAYSKQPKSSYEGCVLITQEILMVTGGALNHKTGQVMVGTSQEVAKRVCGEIYPESVENEMPY